MSADGSCRHLQLAGELRGRRRPFAVQAIEQREPHRMGQRAHRLGVGQDQVAD
jgi:hypothetical protein